MPGTAGTFGGGARARPRLRRSGEARAGSAQVRGRHVGNGQRDLAHRSAWSSPRPCAARDVLFVDGGHALLERRLVISFGPRRASSSPLPWRRRARCGSRFRGRSGRRRRPRSAPRPGQLRVHVAGRHLAEVPPARRARGRGARGPARRSLRPAGPRTTSSACAAVRHTISCRCTDALLPYSLLCCSTIARLPPYHGLRLQLAREHLAPAPSARCCA